MMRQFEFEAEIYQSLNCVPMAARRKLDRLGVKLSLDQWQRFGRGERLMICHAPLSTPDECNALRLFIDEVAIAKTGMPPRSLPEESRKQADPPAEPPLSLIANAQAAGIPLTQSKWERLDDDERYTLVKLGGASPPSHDFKSALEELLGSATK